MPRMTASHVSWTTSLGRLVAGHVRPRGPQHAARPGVQQRGEGHLVAAAQSGDKLSVRRQHPRRGIAARFADCGHAHLLTSVFAGNHSPACPRCSARPPRRPLPRARCAAGGPSCLPGRARCRPRRYGTRSGRARNTAPFRSRAHASRRYRRGRCPTRAGLRPSARIAVHVALAAGASATVISRLNWPSRLASSGRRSRRALRCSSLRAGRTRGPGSARSQAHLRGLGSNLDSRSIRANTSRQWRTFSW